MAPVEPLPVQEVKVKKDKKEKKEKSSKKRKLESTEVTAPAPMEPSASDNIVADVDSSSDVARSHSVDKDMDADVPATKKRKASVVEIEVDITAPEPPSKKALRRIKKGKPLPPSKSGAESTPEPDTKPKAEVEKRSEYGIWIGNLAFHVSKTDLRTFFVEKSDLTEEMITRIHMPGPNDKKSANKVEEKKKFARAEHNKGYAYVDFSTEQGVNIALELSEELLAGRRVIIKDNKSFAGRPEKTKEESRKDGKPPNKRVFLGNLRYDVTEDSLKDHFEKCGPITSVMVATFQDTGKCKGYAWVVFEELEGAENAVRGYVMVEDEPSDVSDSDDESNEEQTKAVTNKPKKKWWVNKIKGRPIRSEYAEDAQVRYKKRYGKDGTKAGNAKPAEGSEEAKTPSASGVQVTKAVEYRKPYAARLTGGIVESKGKKTTF